MSYTEEDGKEYTYAYYTVTDFEYYDEPVFVQVFFFEDDDCFIEYDYSVRTEAIKIGDTGYALYAPVGSEEEEVDIGDAAGEYIFRTYNTEAIRSSKDGIEFSDFSIYVYDANGVSAAEAAAENGDVEIIEKSEITPYTFEGEEGTYDCAYYTYHSKYQGVERKGAVYTIIYGDKIVQIDFHQPYETYEEYIEQSEFGMIYGVAKA